MPELFSKRRLRRASERYRMDFSERSICSHVGCLVLPGPVSVANVRDVFDADGNVDDEALEQRIRGVGTQLLHHIQENVCPRVALEAMVREDAPV